MFNKIKFVFLFLLIPVLSFSQSSQYVNSEAFLNKSSYSANDSVFIALKLSIKEKFHINSINVSDPSLIKTSISSPSQDFTLETVYFPNDKEYKFEFSETKVKVYEGETYTGLSFKIKQGLADGNYNIPLKIYYQACDDKVCYPPKTITFDVPVTINNSALGNLINTSEISKVVFNNPISLKSESNNKESTSTKLTENVRTEAPADENQVAQFVEEKGMFVALILIFLGGLALNLTPCVYPLIPITISYFGAQSSGSKGQSIMMGVSYSLGMSVTYSALGLFAALTGSLLGTALQNPLVIIGVALILIILGTSMFGLFEIRVPQKLALAGNKNRSGYFGSFLMGLLVGFIAAPCIGPFVLSLLLYVGQIGNPVTGFLMFFILAMGLGFPYIFLAASSSALNKLPRSGEWMISVKIIFGLILFGMAINTLSPVIPKEIYNILFPVYVIASGAYLILIDKNGFSSKVYTKIKYIIAILAIVWGTWDLKPTNAGEQYNWVYHKSVQSIETSVNAEKKPVIIDFWADWCAQCKELDEFTYTDKEIIDLSSQLKGKTNK